MEGLGAPLNAGLERRWHLSSPPDHLLVVGYWYWLFRLAIENGELMTERRKAVWRKSVTLTALLLLVAATRPALAADDLDKVLAALDASSAKFKSAQADIDWDNVQTVPVPDDDKQLGTALFARSKDGQMQIAVHLKSDNGTPVQKDLVYAGGVGKLYEARLKQMQVFQVGDKRSELDTFLTLGFGGSGKDLQKSWVVSSAGTESVGGVTAAKLQLVPRDANLAKTAPKVLLWIDTDKGVAVKQQRFDPSGNYVVFSYSNIRLNGSVPSSAFDLKPPSGTQIVNH
jgi:outer membrane lipoprotein-sorting protein